MLTVLVLADIAPHAADASVQIEQARFLESAPHGSIHVAYANLATEPTVNPRWLEYDVVVLHGSVLDWRLRHDYAVRVRTLDWLLRYTGVLVAMPHREHLGAHLLDELFWRARVQILISRYSTQQRMSLYPSMHGRLYVIEAPVPVLSRDRVTVAQQLQRPLASRSVDLLSRPRQRPFWFGALGQRGSALASAAAETLSSSTLRLDIAPRERDVRGLGEWYALLGNARALLSCESGSSALDRGGDVVHLVQALLADTPERSFDEVSSLMDGALARHAFATLSTSHLDAVLARTLLVLIDGEYAGVLEPWIHYLPLKHDLSDLGTLPALLADDALIERITARAYNDLVTSGGYDQAQLARRLVDVVEFHYRARIGQPVRFNFAA